MTSFQRSQDKLAGNPLWGVILLAIIVYSAAIPVSGTVLGAIAGGIGAFLLFAPIAAVKWRFLPTTRTSTALAISLLGACVLLAADAIAGVAIGYFVIDALLVAVCLAALLRNRAQAPAQA